MPRVPEDFRDDRRAFFRRAFRLTPPHGDPAWGEVEARAAAFGIVPGTRVDAQGRPLEGPMLSSEGTLGEIMPVAFNYAPRGWTLCQGQILGISTNTALFSILGTTYGGNGVTTFALPDLRGRMPIGAGQGSGRSDRVLGETSGTETHTLIASEMPAHTHVLSAAATATSADPASALFATSVAGTTAFATANADGAWLLGLAGGSQAHNNMPPFLAINFCLCLSGLFPSRS